ncbi:hypothetical protein EDD16DRAFT_1524631 [Pisolithus croceorrhizus]|nr:hypothetical protein EDD16DRAFT_1524631 [Pisolithus croceorrhizus]
MVMLAMLSRLQYDANHLIHLHVSYQKQLTQSSLVTLPLSVKETYKGTEAPIEWMDTDGTQVWIYVKENQDTSSAPANTGSTSTQPDQQLGYMIVPINIHDIRVHQAACTIAFLKEKGFRYLSRGKWFRSTGTVQAVHFDEACLDFMCDTYGSKSVSGVQLSQWVGQDVWVIRGEKKGYQGTLRSIGRGISCVALQGQLDWAGILMGQFSPSAQFRSCNVDQLSPSSVVHTHHLRSPPFGGRPFGDNLRTHGQLQWKTCLLPLIMVNASSERDAQIHFRSDSGTVPPGHVGSGIQHHVVPATCLSPANPTAKNQLCVTIKGPCFGEAFSIKHCQKNAQKVLTQDGMVMPFDEGQGDSVFEASRYLTSPSLSHSSWAEWKHAGAKAVTGNQVDSVRYAKFNLPASLGIQFASGRLIVGCTPELVVGDRLTRTTDGEDEAEKVSDVAVVVELGVSDATVRAGVSGGGPVESKSVVDFSVVIIVSTEWNGVEMS